MSAWSWAWHTASTQLGMCGVTTPTQSMYHSVGIRTMGIHISFFPYWVLRLFAIYHSAHNTNRGALEGRNVQ